MANHLTPTELARDLGVERREVIDRCLQLGVPIYQGRIDKNLFACALRTGEEVGAGQTAAVDAAAWA